MSEINDECQTVVTNGEQTEECNDDAVYHDIAESPSRSFSTHSEVYISNPNKVIDTSIVKQEDVIQNKIIHEEYVHARKTESVRRCFSK